MNEEFAWLDVYFYDIARRAEKPSTGMQTSTSVDTSISATGNLHACKLRSSTRMKK